MEEKNELRTNLSHDIDVITAEINSYKQMAGQAIFEIGKRLKHARNELFREDPKGWEQWALDHCGMKRAMAYRYMKVYTSFSNNQSSRLDHASIEILSLLTDIDESERETFIEKQHKIPSTGEQKTVDDMTVRELREVKKALKEAEEAKRQAEEEAKQARQSEHIAKKHLERLEEEGPRVVEKVVYEQDEESLKALQQQLTKQKDTLAAVHRENDRLKKELEQHSEKEALYHRINDKIKYLEREATDMQQALEDSEEITQYVMDIEAFTKEKLAPLAYSKALTRQDKSQALYRRMDHAVRAVETWVEDVRRHMDDENIFEAEVVNYE